MECPQSRSPLDVEAALDAARIEFIGMPDENPGITQIAASRCGWPAMKSAPVATTRSCIFLGRLRKRAGRFFVRCRDPRRQGVVSCQVNISA